MENRFALQQMSVGRRLALTSGSLIALMLAMTIYASLQMMAMRTRFDVMMERSAPQFQSIERWELDAMRLAALDQELAQLHGEELRQGIQEAVQLGEQLEADAHAFAAHADLGEEQGVLQALQRYRERFTAAQSEYLRGMATADGETRRRYLAERLQPAGSQLANALEQRREQLQLRNEGARREASERQKRNEIYFLLFAALVCGFGVVAATAAARSISRQVGGDLRDVARIASDVALGAFQAKIQLLPGDESSLLASLYRMREELRRRRGHLHDAVQQLAISSGQLSGSSKSLEATLHEQAASTNEVVASAKQISATSQELLRTMGEVAELSADSANAAGEGQIALGKMSSTMQQIESASAEIAQKLAAIHARVGNITGVVTTIHKVADQTNLLSLNASIEAAKAGEYGQGFSVVAREIRRLADQTAVATSEIEQIVQEMKSSVTAGVMGMEKFAHQVQVAVLDTQQAYAQISSIIQQVQGLQPRFESVNEGMESQSVGARQISEAMLQLSEATRNTANSQLGAARAIELVQQTAQALEVELNKSCIEIKG